MTRALAITLACGTLLACASRPAPAQDLTPDSLATPAGTASNATSAATPRTKDGLEALVPELAGSPVGIDPGVRPYVHRFSLGTGFGSLGGDRLFFLRLGYNPNAWLGYEASIAHVPSQSVQAILHQLNVVIRHPLPGRLQPYLSGGYGMTIVLPGQAVNADPVTKNTLAAGGGLEMYIRSDLAIRAEMRGTAVLGRELNHEGVVTYGYREQTIGLAFYRQLKP